MNREKILGQIADECILHGVKFNLSPEKSIIYPNSTMTCSGYFIDYGHPELAVATDKPELEWLMVLLHESCHMKQWIEKSDFWVDSFIDGRESIDYINEWVEGKEFTNEELKKLSILARDVEWDCEKRTIERAKAFNLNINYTEEIQRANSYILFYNFILETRKWYKTEFAPYRIREVWSLAPKDFNYDKTLPVSKELKEAYLKYCF